MPRHITRLTAVCLESGERELSLVGATDCSDDGKDVAISILALFNHDHVVTNHIKMTFGRYFWILQSNPNTFSLKL